MNLLDWLGTMRTGNLSWEQIDLTYFYIIVVIMAVYFLIRPLIKWIVVTQSVKLLNYVMCSLLVLVFLLGGMVLTAVFRLILLEAVLQSLAVFGVCLGMVHLMQYIFRSKKKRV